MLCLALAMFSMASAAEESNTGLSRDPAVRAAVEAFRRDVLEMMSQHKVPGSAFALVDKNGIIWTEGFGHTTAKSRIPVTPDTPFFLGGLAKLVSSTAVMTGVQQGKLALDVPITTYLPDFQVHSRYETNAQLQITLRYLLNQTAGMPVEAPLGNYFEPQSAASFEEHIRSLYGNWLVFPVGKAFQNGNASADLAAYLLQVTTGEAFEVYLQSHLFEPLGMTHSTADRNRIVADKTRAIGHMMGIAKMPATLPCLGAASIYSSAHDLARFLQFQINQGVSEDRRLLAPEWMNFLHTPAGVYEKDKTWYGAGVYLEKRGPGSRDTVLWADGWGFGVCGLLLWYPEYGIGTVGLANRLPNPDFNKVTFSLTDRLIAQGVVHQISSPPILDTNRCVGTWWGWSDHKPTPYHPEWRKYCGLYKLRFNAYELEWWAKIAVLIKGRDEYTPQITVQQKDGFLCVTESPFFDLIGIGRHKNEPLQEISKGLFSARSGIVLDLTQGTPRWRNYRMQGH